MQRTNIEWVINSDGSKGYTWNPVTGCLHDCPYCYARKIAKRFTGHFKPTFHTNRLDQPLKLKKPSTIFICSMADLFGNWVPNEWIEDIVWEIVKGGPMYTWLFLTKNPGRYSSDNYLSRMWLGVTITKNLDLIEVAYKNFFRVHNHNYISFEPLLGPADCLDYICSIPKSHIDWLIIGSLNVNGKPVPPEKGGTKREWVLEIVEQADKRKIPVFIKDSLYELYPDLPYFRELPYLKKES